MKKRAIYLFPLALLCVIFTLSCSHKNEVSCICDDSSGKSSFEVVNLTGIVNYNDEIKTWYISVAKPGTYDQTQVFLTNDIPAGYKKGNTKVVFSGRASTPSVQLASVGGSEYFCVKISNINLQ